jgi:hypothetical protein
MGGYPLLNLLRLGTRKWADNVWMLWIVVDRWTHRIEVTELHLFLMGDGRPPLGMGSSDGGTHTSSSPPRPTHRHQLLTLLTVLTVLTTLLTLRTLSSQSSPSPSIPAPLPPYTSPIHSPQYVPTHPLLAPSTASFPRPRRNLRCNAPASPPICRPSERVRIPDLWEGGGVRLDGVVWTGRRR